MLSLHSSSFNHANEGFSEQRDHEYNCTTSQYCYHSRLKTAGSIFRPPSGDECRLVQSSIIATSLYHNVPGKTGSNSTVMTAGSNSTGSVDSW